MIKEQIVIVGGNGFLGRSLVKQYNDTNLIIPKRDQFDLTNPKCWEILFSKYQPDIVFNLAAISHPLIVKDNPQKAYSTNVHSIDQLLLHLPENCRLIYPSSVHVYGIPLFIPIDESHSTKPTNIYGKHKLEVEEKILSSEKNICIARLFHTISMRKPSKSSFLYDWKEQVKTVAGQPIEVGNTKVVRDFLHVDDTTSALKLISKRGKCGNIYNICSGTGVQLKTIIESLDLTYHVNKSLLRENEILTLVGCNRKLKELGWIQKHINPIIKDDFFSF